MSLEERLLQYADTQADKAADAMREGRKKEAARFYIAAAVALCDVAESEKDTAERSRLHLKAAYWAMAGGDLTYGLTCTQKALTDPAVDTWAEAQALNQQIVQLVEDAG